jgi:hypothetical protein
MQIWRAVNEQRWGDVPPILHFSKHEAGTVRFNGVCVLADVNDAWFEDNGKRVRNYHAVLDVLPVDIVTVEWLRARVIEEGRAMAPFEWKVYASTGEHTRSVVWAHQIRSESEQLPARDSIEHRVLEHLHSLDPFLFEHIVVRAFETMPIAHKIKATPPTKDGGFDFYGTFVLPPPLGYSIALKGEVKRYAPGENKVGPKDVSRLVARLQRGEHGVFVTTSAFTRQCQDEVFADQYPVELIPGLQLVGILQQLGAVQGRGLQPSWLEAPR